MKMNLLNENTMKKKTRTTMMVMMMMMMVMDCEAGVFGSESYYPCDQNYIGQLGSGIITHDNYPFNYTERLNCRHRFYIQSYHSMDDPWTICFTFLRFSLGDSETCSDDYLEFSVDGLRFCGAGHRGTGGRRSQAAVQQPDNIFTSPLCWPLNQRSVFDIVFASQAGSSNLGFYAHYTISNVAKPDTPCTVDSTTSSLSTESLLNCQPENTACATAGEFRCFTGSTTCIPGAQMCDGVNQCNDGSDESYTHARCHGKQDLRACSFESGLWLNGDDDDVVSYCGMRVDGWISSTGLPNGQATDHTYRGVLPGRFLYSDYTKQDFVYVNYTVPRDMMDHNVGSYCLRFHYYMSGRVGELMVRLKTEGGWSITWVRKGAQAMAWLTGEILIEQTVLPVYEISFQVYNTPSTTRSIGLDDISLIEGQCLSDDISCTFSDGLCGWRPHFSALGASWTRSERVAPSRYTGPSSDHTNNNGSFLYFNGSQYSQGQIARLVSRPINQGYSGSHCLHMWYYMYGSGVGSLRVYTLGNSGATVKAWEKNGNQDHKWLQAGFTLSLMTEPFQIILEAERGANVMSDIAVDDIQLTPGYCDRIFDGGFGGSVPMITAAATRPGTGCGWFEQACASGNQCFDMRSRCDGFFDCDDHSDEFNCGRVTSTPSGLPKRCKPGEARCSRTLVCIDSSKLCDGFIDCDDRSDELRCKTGGELLPGDHHAYSTISPGVIIGSVICGFIILLIALLAFILIARRRRFISRGMVEGGVTSGDGASERDPSPVSLLANPVSPPSYADLTPPPYSALDDKDGPFLPPSYESTIAPVVGAVGWKEPDRQQTGLPQTGLRQAVGQLPLEHSELQASSPKRSVGPVPETEC